MDAASLAAQPVESARSMCQLHQPCAIGEFMVAVRARCLASGPGENVAVKVMANVERMLLSKHERERVFFQELQCPDVSGQYKHERSKQTLVWKCLHSSSEELCVEEVQRWVKASKNIVFLWRAAGPCR